MTKHPYAVSIFAAALLASSGLAARAQPAAPAPSPSFKQLIGEGFEIKAVTIVPSDVLKAASIEDTTPRAVVSLQKGPLSAACVYNAANWWNQVPASMEGTTQCTVYPPR